MSAKNLDNHNRWRNRQGVYHRTTKSAGSNGLGGCYE